MLQNCYETLYTECINMQMSNLGTKYNNVKSGTTSAIRAKEAAKVRAHGGRAYAYTREGKLELERKLRKLANNDGLTLRAGQAVSYKTGWQVADYGVERKTARAAANVIAKLGGTAGVWYSNGIYYIDHSFRVNTKREALKIGREHNQISVLKWSDMSLVYC